MQKYSIAIIGATGYVGQRLVNLLQNHPFFEIKYLFASKKSAGKTYQEALSNKVRVKKAEISEKYLSFPVFSLEDINKLKGEVSLVFCAVDLPKDEIILLETILAQMEIVVISNNSANRMMADVPTLIPEINENHLAILDQQKKRLGTTKGFIVCKPNCSIQSYVPALVPLLKYKPQKVLVSTYQAISGAGKDFFSWPEMQANLIPYISGEEEKSEIEPLKILGKVDDKAICLNQDLVFSAQCYRVAVEEGHTASVWINFLNPPSIEEIIEAWVNFKPEIYKLNLPSAPSQFLVYHHEVNRPQVRLDVETDKGMSIHLGRLQKDKIFDYKFTCLSHNTLRGSACGSVLTAELVAKRGLL